MFKKIINITIFGSLFLLLGCTDNKTPSLSEKEQACNSNDVKHCSDVAYDYYMNKKNYKKAVNYAKVGCDNNQAKGCKILGLSYNSGNGVKKNVLKAKDLYEKACKVGDGAVGCPLLALGYSLGENGVKKNYQKASHFFKIACNKGEVPSSCKFLAINYKYGKGVKKDDGLAIFYYRKSLKLYEKNCKSGDIDACYSLGVIYHSGDSFSHENDKRALEYLNIGCEKNESLSCIRMGLIYEKGSYDLKDLKKAKKLYLKACDNGIELGCEYFGRLNYR